MWHQTADILFIQDIIHCGIGYKKKHTVIKCSLNGSIEKWIVLTLKTNADSTAE